MLGMGYTTFIIADILDLRREQVTKFKKLTFSKAVSTILAWKSKKVECKMSL